MRYMLSYVAVPTTSIRVEEGTTAGLSIHVSTVGDIPSTTVTKSTNEDIGKYKQMMRGVLSSYCSPVISQLLCFTICIYVY